MTAISVFVGCAANGEDLESQAVLEHSLRSRTRAEVVITWMQLSRDPKSPFFSDGQRGWQTQLWSTPFSGFRWLVPELCGWEGRAIYCDSDTIWLDDVERLWNVKMAAGKAVVAKGATSAGESWRFCVSLWDCRALHAIIPGSADLMRDATSHRQLVARFRNSPLVQPFPKGENWNCIDGEDYADLSDPKIKVLHYSSEAHQPQLRLAVPRLARSGRTHWFDGRVERHWRKDVEELFDRELAAAEAAGIFPENYQPRTIFGAYNKMSHARGYRTNQWGQRARSAQPGQMR